MAGVQISVDVLPFGKSAQLAREAAGKARVDAQVNSYQQQIRLQVNQAHIQRKTANFRSTPRKRPSIRRPKGLRILKNRYGAGLATITDLLRAEDAERQAQSNYWHAVYGNAMAYAERFMRPGL